ncbi:hypothetical protein D3C77_697000 [compost metagenome]
MKINLVWGLTPFSLAEKAMKYLSTAEQTASFSSPDYSIQNKQWRMKIKQVPNQIIFRNSSLHTIKQRLEA